MESQVPERRVVELSNQDLYDAWSSTYDTDGNILQALDTFALDSTMFARLFKAVIDLLPAQEEGEDLWRITDLGCGTGRADLCFLAALRSSQNEDLVVKLATKRYQTVLLKGADFSQSMVGIAEDRVPAFASVGSTHVVNTEYGMYDIFDEDDQGPPAAHTIISTLVIEHIPLELYFRRVAALLLPGGLLLMTNMHPDMGDTNFQDSINSSAEGRKSPETVAATRAGFIDLESNTKYRGTSYAHTVDEVQVAATAIGFNLIGPVEEKRVEGWMLEERHGTPALLGERGRKWVGINCWFGIIFQLEVPRR